MRFLIDENVRREATQFLIERDRDVKRAPKGLSNGASIQLIKEEDRILLTHDKDFVDSSLYPAESLPGIVLLKIHPPNVTNILAALENLLRQHASHASLRGTCITLEKI